MTLKIRHLDELIRIEFASDKLDISKTSEQWSQDGINNFLLKLSLKTPEGEWIEIKQDEPNPYSEINEKIYKYICDIFKTFVDNYNQAIQ